MDARKRFEQALDRVVNNERRREGIGTLGEKTLHAVLKYFYEEDDAFHEVKLGGFNADIARNGSIIEIQTGSFYPLRKKLDQFLVSCRVTVVHPIAVNKTLCWIDPESGQIVSKRLLSKKGRIYDVLKVLPAIKELIDDDNFTLTLIMLDIEEYRLLDGRDSTRKRRATKLEKLPTAYVEEIVFQEKRDYMMLLPDVLGNAFTFAEFQKAVRLQRVAAHRALKLFLDLGFVRLSHKEGNKHIYEISEI